VELVLEIEGFLGCGWVQGSIIEGVGQIQKVSEPSGGEP